MSVAETGRSRRPGFGLVVIILVVVLALVYAAVYVDRQRRAADRSLIQLGEFPLTVQSLTSRAQVVVTRDGAVVGGQSELGTTLVRVDHDGRVGKPVTIPRGGLDRTFVDDDGGLWFADGRGGISYQPGKGKGWTAQLGSRGSAELVGADGDTALVAVDNCGKKKVRKCQAVLGVRDGKVAWRTRVEAANRVPTTVSGTVDDDPELLDAPRFAVAAVGGKLVTVNGSGDLKRTGAAVQLDHGSLFATIIGDQILVSGSAGRCSVRSVTVHRWTAQVPCGFDGRQTTRSAMIDFSDDSGSLARLTQLTGVDLATGSVRTLADTRGIVGLADDVLVSGEGGRYRAQSITTGRVLWTYQADHADTGDGSFGTGVASVSPDSVLVTSHLDGWLGRIDGNQHGERVSLLDRDSGTELATGIIPDGHSVRDVMALPGHRGLIATTDDQLWLIGPEA